MKEKLTLSNEIITINNHSVKKIFGGFGDGQPCILAKQVAELHGYEVREINQLVNNNLDWFDEGIDIIDLKKVLNSDMYLRYDFLINSGFYTNTQAIGGAKNIYIFSQQGYSLLCKLLKSDIAKQVYKSVIREYFSTKASDRWLDCLPAYARLASISDSKGFIYIIRNPNGKVKIGRSRNPLKRIRNIQTQGGFWTNKIFVSDKFIGYEIAEVRLHQFFENRKFIGEWFSIRFEDAVMKCREIINSEIPKWLDKDESESQVTKKTDKESTQYVSGNQPPKFCQGWNLNKRGKNKNGEMIYNLVRKINGKRHQKYLGVWNQEKADQIIDEMNREHGLES